jgi:ABC-2 type transport system ATP-binding protein
MGIPIFIEFVNKFAKPTMLTTYCNEQEEQIIMAILETRKLAKTYKSRNGSVEAVCGVDLQVNEGEIFGFLGPNGAGKSTTMRMLSTLLSPSGGQATICGYDLLRESGKVRKQIGYVGQKGGTESKETG